VKDEVRNHFGIDNDRLFFDENNIDEEERERRTKDEYQFIFTSGATASLKLVAERFPWTSLKFTTASTTSASAAGRQYSQILMKCDTIPSTNDDSIQYNNLQSIHFRSILLYPKNVHTSVIGMRNISLQHEATFHCVTVEELLLEATSPSWFQRLVADDATIISYKESMEEALKNHDSGANYCRSEEKKDDHSVVQEEQCCDNMTSVTCKTIWVHHLLVLPQECNFSGDRFDWSNTIAAARNSTFCTYLNCSTATTTGGQHQLLRVCHKWNVLLDVAKAAATSPVDIPNMCSPDYAVASFYKMFGYPTGLGILIMKKEPKRVRRIMDDTSEEESMMINSSEAPSLGQQENVHSPRRRHYFGGGSVDVILPHKDFVITRNSQQLVDDNDGEHVNLGVMVHGTEHFRGILQLTHGFKELKSLGGMKAICSHTTCLADELVCRLKKLVHDNGSSVVQIYGRWGDIRGKSTLGKGGVLLPGPTVTFNIQDRDGSIIGYDEVSRLSSLNNPPIQLRTGCFCNPGACQEALALSESDVLEHYQSGHVCGDRRGVINGKPTGAIRASFGKDSVWEDMNALVSFIQKVFVSRGGDLSLLSGRRDNARNENAAVIDSLFVFPIKSCAAMKVNRWPIHCQTGRFLFDREFALVDSSGSAMRLHSYPQMSQIHSSIDLDTNILIVSAPHRDDLVLGLDVSEGDETITPEDVQVCGVLCKGTIWGGRKASSWFSSILGVRCWLARHHVDEKKAVRSGNKRNDGLAYSNEASLLLVSQNSISILNAVISSQDWGKQVVARHFRPNIVVSSSSGAQEDETDFPVIGNPEDFWQKICIKSEDNKELELIAVGKCARCQMVDVDPDSGMKGKTLRALAEYRRERGKILFGTFFTANTNESREVFWVEEGAEVRASST
jgi:molybdenum cofactor sulfurtransferase